MRELNLFMLSLMGSVQTIIEDKANDWEIRRVDLDNNYGTLRVRFRNVSSGENVSVAASEDDEYLKLNIHTESNGEIEFYTNHQAINYLVAYLLNNS